MTDLDQTFTGTGARADVAVRTAHHRRRLRRQRRQRRRRLFAAIGATLTLLATVVAIRVTPWTDAPTTRAAITASPAGPTTAEPTATPTIPPPAPGPSTPASESAAIPEPVAAVVVPDSGPGTFAVAPGTGALTGSGALTRYTVEVETGLPFLTAEVTGMVEATLADPRSWTTSGRHALQRIDADADVRILVATPMTTDQLCAPLQTRGEVSCRRGELVVLNATRWAIGIDAYGGDLDGYRRYLINHEVGHALGQPHQPCLSPGQPAPVMLQQTYGLDGCLPNPWPYPA